MRFKTSTKQTTVTLPPVHEARRDGAADEAARVGARQHELQLGVGWRPGSRPVDRHGEARAVDVARASEREERTAPRLSPCFE